MSARAALLRQLYPGSTIHAVQKLTCEDSREQVWSDLGGESSGQAAGSLLVSRRLVSESLECAGELRRFVIDKVVRGSLIEVRDRRVEGHERVFGIAVTQKGRSERNAADPCGVGVTFDRFLHPSDVGGVDSTQAPADDTGQSVPFGRESAGLDLPVDVEALVPPTAGSRSECRSQLPSFTLDVQVSTGKVKYRIHHVPVLTGDGNLEKQEHAVVM